MLRASSLLISVVMLPGFLQFANGESQIVDVKVHSRGLEHNLLGDPADQPVAIYLPEAYSKNAQQRFPAVYFLHGFSDITPRHEEAGMFRKAMDGLIASGTAKPMILVLPNGMNKYMGSFYANSSTTGNWADYIVQDVVGYVDSHYRTLATAEHRGIVGHSMGGYGALTLAFRNPDTFGSVYAMSPCCTDLVGDLGPSNPAWTQLNKLQSPDQVPQALHQGEFFVAAFSAISAALAPNAKSKMLGDYPFVEVGKQLRTNPAAYEAIASQMPVNMVAPLAPNIVRLRGIFIEYGAQENFTHIVEGAQELAQRLSAAGVSFTLEVFQGDHGNHIVQRVSERMLPWMSKQLAQ